MIFQQQQYQLFDDLFNELAAPRLYSKSFVLETMVNHTENRPALHHRYRCRSTQLPEFNFREICAPLLQAN